VKDKIEHSAECLLIVKTSRDLFDQLRLKLESFPFLRTAGVLALPVIAGSPTYLAWLDASLCEPDASLSEPDASLSETSRQSA